jgi:probable rRNA maturation factor
MAVTLQNSQHIPFRTARLLKAARNVLRAEGASSAEVSLVLTNDDAVHALNRDYRGYDKPTDVLSFAQRDQVDDQPHDLSDALPPFSSPSPGNEILGDVVISVETAARQADTHGVSLDDELALLVTHGVLHLLGYEDDTDEGAEKMEQRERALGVRR